MPHAKTPAPLAGGNRGGVVEKLEGPDDIAIHQGTQSYNRLVERVHALGPRALAEMLAEVVDQDEAAGRLIAAALARYARIDPAALLVVRGDRFPPAPLLLVG